MEESNRLMERQRLWEAAQRMDEGSLGEGLSHFGARALGLFRENGVKNILALGCGQDREALLLANKGFCVVTIDFSSVGLDQTGERKKAESIDRCGIFLAQNIRDRFPEPRSSVDAIYSKLFLCLDLREEEIKDIMWECLQVLKPGGLKILSVFSDHDPDCGITTKCGEDEWVVDRGFVSRYFTEDKINRIAKGFKILWIREYKENEPLAPGVMYEIVLMKPK
jgi:SAM-dependent methyltransferase